MRTKYVIYTSITGGYDKIPDYKYLDPEFDYICFSNEYENGSYVGHWKIKNISQKIKDPRRLSRFPKMNPHLVLPEYEYSVWVDGNISIISSNVYDEIKKQIKGNVLWSGIIHPDRDCVFEEIKFCLSKGKDTVYNLIKTGLFLRLHRFPRQAGLLENNFLIRKHTDPAIIKVDADWWNLYKNFSWRDQITLPYVLSDKNFRITPFLLPSINIARDSRFNYSIHSKSDNKRPLVSDLYRKLILYVIALLKLF